MNIMHRNVTIHNHLLLNWMRTQNKSISNWIGVSGEKGQEAKAELNISDGSASFFFYFIRNRQTNLYTRWYINRNVNQHFAACISYLFGEKRRKSKPTKFAYIEIDIICRKRDLILKKKNGFDFFFNHLYALLFVTCQNHFRWPYSHLNWFFPLLFLPWIIHIRMSSCGKNTNRKKYIKNDWPKPNSSFNLEISQANRAKSK